MELSTCPSSAPVLYWPVSFLLMSTASGFSAPSASPLPLHLCPGSDDAGRMLAFTSVFLIVAHAGFQERVLIFGKVADLC